MSDLRLNLDKRLSKKDIIPGKLYIAHNNLIMLYIGTTLDSLESHHLFYKLVPLMTQEVHNTTTGRSLQVINSDIQIPGLCKLITFYLSNKGNRDLLVEYTNIPNLIGEFTYLDFSAQYKDWYTKSFNGVEGTPVIDESNIIKTNYVGSRELIPGCLYYGSGCWRNTFVYLGRNSNKEYMWYFVTNGVSLIDMNVTNMISKSFTTKNNKKVKRLEDAPRDMNAHIGDDIKLLIIRRFKVDMSGVTQEMLDRKFLY